MKKTNVFLETMSAYLVKYAPVTRGLSKNTIRTYTITFQLLFMYLKAEKGLLPVDVMFSTLEQSIIEDFLSWLEANRKCSTSTRNHRLRCLSSFARYSIEKNPVDAVGFYNAVNGIPSKKANKPLPIYFTKEEIAIILHLPSSNGRTQNRNRSMLSVMYASGARAQELCDIRVCDIRFGEKTSVKLVGKGNKARSVTIPEQCSKLLKNYLISMGKVSDPDRYVFSSQTHEHMTISCVEEVVKKYVAIAKKNHPTLFREKNYTPHTFRHSIAVHMLEAGIPLPVIKNFLGHSSIEVTMIYATVSDELKNKYIKDNSIATSIPTDIENISQSQNKYLGLEFLNGIK